MLEDKKGAFDLHPSALSLDAGGEYQGWQQILVLQCSGLTQNSPKEVTRAPDHHLQTAAPVNPVLDGFPLETGQEGTEEDEKKKLFN